MPGRLSRRDLLRGSGAAVTLGWATKTQAALTQPDLSKLLNGVLPPQLRSILPQQATQAAEIISEVLKLEQQARLLRLPPSRLAWHEGKIPADPDKLYELAMPRLVTLIDRAGRSGAVLGEQAGALLARLHRTQYDAPDAWFSTNAVAATDRTRPGDPDPGMADLPVRPLRLADPPTGGGDPAGIRLDLPQMPVPVPESVLPPVATSLRFGELSDEYAAWFAAARIRPDHQDSAIWHLTMMRESRPRYAAVSKRLGVPWYFIAAVHGLEASFNFRAHLHNGDFPLSRRTHQVPSGRPLVWLPPSDWEDSATDALRLMGFAGQDDWSLPRLLYRLEAYNGFGYRRAGRASPYLWSFSTLYDRGKFVADGRFDPHARSQQCGAAVMLKVLADAGELA